MWENLGLYGGQVKTLAADPHNAQALWAGTWGGDGLFKSTDGGASWQAIPLFKNMSVHDISIDPNNPGTIWIAEEHYILVSYDDGQNWYYWSFLLDEGRFCYSIAVDPHDKTGGTVYAGTGGPAGTDEYGEIYKTTDGGSNWDPWGFSTDSEYVRFNFWDINIHPANPGEIWVANRASYLSPQGRIYMSPDDGVTWWYWTAALYGDEYELAESLGYLDEVIISPSDPDLIFAGGAKGVAVNPDGALTDYWYWTELSDFDNGTFSCRALCIPPSDPDTVYAGLLNDIAKTTDSGETWELTSSSPAEFLSMEADHEDGSLLYGGSVNQGVFKSADGARTWSSANQGIRANTIYDTAVDPEEGSGAILCGTLAGVYSYTDNGMWNKLNSSSSEAVIFHPHNPETLYIGCDWSLKKSTDGGNSWIYINTPDQTEGNKVTALDLISESDSADTVIAGISFSSGKRGQIIKITGWEYDIYQDMETLLETAVPVNAVALHPENKDIMFAGTGSFWAPIQAGGLYISKNGGSTWIPRLLLQGIVVNSIAVAPSSPDIIYLGCGDSAGGHEGIYKSTNGGLTWQKRAEGLPPHYCVSDIKVDPENSDIVYASLFKGFTEDYSDLSGIYISIDGGGYWSQIGLSAYRLYDVNCALSGESGRTATGRMQQASRCAFPESTVIAGSTSGIYSSSTTGMGIVAGEIFCQNTLQPLDGAIVSSQYGSNAMSVDGYYLLMTAAGVNSLRVQMPGYTQITAPAVQVSPGASATQNITMQPLSQDNSTYCIASALADTDRAHGRLSALRSFREQCLSGSRLGAWITSAYYSLGRDIMGVLDGNPILKRRCRRLMIQASRTAADIVAGKCTAIPAALKDDASHLLLDIQRASPPCVQMKIKDVRLRLLNADMGLLFRKRD